MTIEQITILSKSLNLDELLALSKTIDKLIKKRQNEQIKLAQKQVAELAEKLGVAPEDLVKTRKSREI